MQHDTNFREFNLFNDRKNGRYRSLDLQIVLSTGSAVYRVQWHEYRSGVLHYESQCFGLKRFDEALNLYKSLEVPNAA